MAALDWKSMIKPATKQANPSTALTTAQKLARNMDRALADYKAGKKDGRPVIRLIGSDVQFSVRFANKAVELAPGIFTATVPAVQFEAVYDAIREDALAGHFDKQLEATVEKVAARGLALQGPRTKASDLVGVRADAAPTTKRMAR